MEQVGLKLGFAKDIQVVGFNMEQMQRKAWLAAGYLIWNRGYVLGIGILNKRNRAIEWNKIFGMLELHAEHMGFATRARAVGGLDMGRRAWIQFNNN